MSNSEEAQVTINGIARSKQGYPQAWGKDDRGRSYFFPPPWVEQARLQKGKRYTVQAQKQNGQPNIYVIDVKPDLHPNVNRDKWRKTAFDQGLPETKPGEPVPLEFGCYCCGTKIVDSATIHKMKGGSVWTKGKPLTLRPYGETRSNPSKNNTPYQQACCAKCNFNLGTFYPQKYEADEQDRDELRQFPCYKLIFQRSTKKCPFYKAQHLLLLGEKDSVERTFQQEFGRHVRVPARVDTATHPLACQLRETHLARLQAEDERDRLAQEVKALQADAQAAREAMEDAARGDGADEYGVRMDRPCDGYRGQTEVYQLSHAGAAVDRSPGALHYSVASSQFLLLLKRDVVELGQIELWHNRAIERRYQEKRRSFEAEGKPSDEIFVFHGTNKAGFLGICKDGFKVGGLEVEIKNAAYHGLGVYTATGPNTPLAYSGDFNCVILAKGLVGVDESDSRRPRKDWHIFSDSSQLLPMYALFYKK